MSKLMREVTKQGQDVGGERRRLTVDDAPLPRCRKGLKSFRRADREGTDR